MQAGNSGLASPSAVMVYVDRADKHDLAGRMASPSLGVREFSGLLALIKELEAFYDETQFPQNSMRLRSFRDRPKRGLKAAEERRNAPMENQKIPRQEFDIGSEAPGKQATFVVNVLFRQNATWQGSVRWIDRDRVQNFRSTLELISLMEGALSQSGEPVPTDRWGEPGGDEEA